MIDTPDVLSELLYKMRHQYIFSCKDEAHFNNNIRYRIEDIIYSCKTHEWNVEVKEFEREIVTTQDKRGTEFEEVNYMNRGLSYTISLTNFLREYEVEDKEPIYSEIVE